MYTHRGTHGPHPRPRHANRARKDRRTRLLPISTGGFTTKITRTHRAAPGHRGSQVGVLTRNGMSSRPHPPVPGGPPSPPAGGPHDLAWTGIPCAGCSPGRTPGLPPGPALTRGLISKAVRRESKAKGRQDRITEQGQKRVPAATLRRLRAPHPGPRCSHCAARQQGPPRLGTSAPGDTHRPLGTGNAGEACGLRKGLGLRPTRCRRSPGPVPGRPRHHRGLLSPLLTHSLFTGPAGARAQQPAPPRGAARVGAWRPREAPADPTAVGTLAPWGPRLDPGSCHSREKPLKVTCTRTAEAAPLRCTRGRRRRPALGPPPRFRAQPMT